MKEHGGYHSQATEMKIIEEELSVRAYDNADFMNDLEIFDSLFGWFLGIIVIVTDAEKFFGEFEKKKKWNILFFIWVD